MENMRPGVVERLGVDYATLREVNPRLIYCSVTAFGSDGPYRERPGFDPLIQAMSGVMTIQGFGGPPQYVRTAITDYYTAALGCQAVLAALFARERTGQGQRVETSLLQAGLALQSGSIVDYPGRGEPVYRDTPTYRLYQASDGEWFFLACGNQSFWVKLCTALGREDLAHDPRFGSWLARRDNADALTPLLEEAFASSPRRVARHARRARHPGAPDPDGAAVHARSRRAASQHDRPRTSIPRSARSPSWASRCASPNAAPDAGPPPVLGQHTADGAAGGRLHRRRDRRSPPSRRRGGKGPPCVSYEAILLEQHDGVATITLNRPDVLNAQNTAMRRDLVNAFSRCAPTRRRA